MDSLVTLPKQIAIKVVEDLTKLDHLDSLNAINEENIEVLTKKVTVQDMLIANQKKMINNLQEQVILKAEMLKVEEDKTEHWKSQFKRQRAQKIGMAGIFIVVTATLAVLL